jgi:perosamine synthetase
MSNTTFEKVFIDSIVDALRSVVGNGEVALHEPEFVGNEWKYVQDCLDSGYVSSVGEYVNKFERQLETYTGAKHAIAVVNGTSALHIALRLAGVRDGDEVIIPALSFAATANAVLYCGAEPHFADSEISTLGIDVAKLRLHLEEISDHVNGACMNKVTGKRIRAVVPMHTFGHPSNLDGILKLCDDFGLIMVEDAAESLGSWYKEKHTGTFGLLGTLSFNGNKTITTGGGGAILTSDDDLAARAKHLTTTAKVPHKWAYKHDELGFNYRLPNINAAIGCAQMESLELIIERQRTLHDSYLHAFSSIENVRLFEEVANCRSNYWLQTLLLSHDASKFLTELLDYSGSIGIMIRPAWDLLNSLSYLQSFQTMNLDSSLDLAKRIVNIPSSPKLIE